MCGGIADDLVLGRALAIRNDSTHQHDPLGKRLHGTLGFVVSRFQANRFTHPVANLREHPLGLPDREAAAHNHTVTAA